MNWTEIFPPIIPRNPQEWLAKCPAHDDGKASLSVRLTPKRVLLKCFAGDGCPVAEIATAAGIKMADLFTDAKTPATRNPSRVVATYPYRDETGVELFQVVRMEPKAFQQRQRANPRAPWVWNLKGIRRVPYRLPEILKRAGQPVVVVEGEKDADRLAGLGIESTCNNGGAGKWPLEFGRYFTGRRVAIIPDRDAPGFDHAGQVAGSLVFHGASEIAIVRLPEPAKDVSDFLNRIGADGKADIVKLIRAADWFGRKG